MITVLLLDSSFILLLYFWAGLLAPTPHVGNNILQENNAFGIIESQTLWKKAQREVRQH